MLAIHDPHATAKVLHAASFFESLGGQGHAGAAGAKHLREEFMSQGQGLGIDAILAHQQPAGEALIQLMKAVTSSNLAHLQTVHEGLAQQFFPKRRSQWKQFGQHVGVDATAAA